MTSPPSEKRDASSVSEHAEKPDSVKIDIKGAPPAPKPVSFFTLFRFATRTENFLNVIGLFAAAAVGSAQVSMAWTSRVPCFLIELGWILARATASAIVALRSFCQFVCEFRISW